MPEFVVLQTFVEGAQDAVAARSWSEAGVPCVAVLTAANEHATTVALRNCARRVGAAGVPCAPVNTVQDILEDPHVAVRGVISKRPGPQTGDVMQVRSPIGKKLDRHTREVLAQLGCNAAEIDALFAAAVAINQEAKALRKAALRAQPVLKTTIT